MLAAIRSFFGNRSTNDTSHPSIMPPAKKTTPRATGNVMTQWKNGSTRAPPSTGTKSTVASSSKKAAPRGISSPDNSSPMITRSKAASANAAASTKNTSTISSPGNAALIAISLIENTSAIISSSKGNASLAPTQAQDTSPQFFCFRKLPYELRRMIWQFALVPRIVGLKPDTIPGISQACSESREESKYFFKIRDFKAGIFFQPKYDIFFLDKSSFAKKLFYHSTAYHTLRCRSIKRSLLKPVQRVALSVDEILAVWRSECFHCFLRDKMPEYFPNIKELILILRPGPLGAGYEDLYEVDKIDNTHTQALIDDVKSCFEHAQEQDPWKNVELKFMRMEKWGR